MTQKYYNDLLVKHVRDPHCNHEMGIYRGVPGEYKRPDFPLPIATREQEDTGFDISVLKERTKHLPSVVSGYDNVITIPERYHAEPAKLIEDVNYDVRLMQRYIESQERQFEHLRQRDAPKADRGQ